MTTSNISAEVVPYVVPYPSSRPLCHTLGPYVRSNWSLSTLNHRCVCVLWGIFTGRDQNDAVGTMNFRLDAVQPAVPGWGWRKSQLSSCQRCRRLPERRRPERPRQQSADLVPLPPTRDSAPHCSELERCFLLASGTRPQSASHPPLRSIFPPALPLLCFSAPV